MIQQSDTANTKTGGLDPYTGTWSSEQQLHLIRRALFGVTHDDHLFFSKLTLQQSLDHLLTPSPYPYPPVNAYNDNSYTDPDVPFGKTWVDCPHTDDKGIADEKRLRSIKAWWIGLMLGQDRSLTEKMTLFWHNHIAAEFSFMKDARTDYSYAAPLRKHALGNFRRLIGDITVCIGMLEYLGGVESTAEAPNENYGRELQELFTVGKGPDSHYTQGDIIAASRILTGWTTDEAIYVRSLGESPPDPAKIPKGVKTIFHPDWHDSGDKHFSSFYNNTVIKGKKGYAGSEETAELIDMIFSTTEVARHTCRGLYRWFVNCDIDTGIETNIIEPLGDIFIKNNFEVIPVLRELLGSKHFFDQANMGCQIKNPVDHLIGFGRQFGIMDLPADLSKQYQSWYTISTSLGSMGMCPGDPPNVAGWPAYYLSPGYYQLWINSDTIVARDYAIDMLLSDTGLSDQEQGVNIKLDLLGFTARCPGAPDEDHLITDSTTLLSPIPFDHTQTALLKKILSPDQSSDHPWRAAWAAYSANPDDQATRNIVTGRLRSFYTYILQRGECQLI